MQLHIVAEAPQELAWSLADKHLKSLGATGCKLLAQYQLRQGRPAPLTRTKQGEQIVDWLLAKPEHYMWLWRAVEAACQEWRFRFDRQHGSEHTLSQLPRIERVAAVPKSFPNTTGLALLPDETIVALYRRHYTSVCLQGADWSRRHPPGWIPQVVAGKSSQGLQVWTTLFRERSPVGSTIWDQWQGNWINESSRRNTDG